MNKTPRNGDELDEIEVIAAVCNFFVKGLEIRQIVEKMAKEYPEVSLTREAIYPMLRKAARRDWLRFQPPRNLGWSKRLEDENPWLQSVQVVHTTAARHVAQVGAESLLRLIQGYRRDLGRREVHIGFSGGHTTRALAHEFAKLLLESTDHAPDRLVIHAMAAGFDPRDPTTDPNTFCSYFANGRLNEVEVGFRGFAATAMVKTEDIRALRDQPGIQEAFAAVREIDIIVASGSSWLDEHSALRVLMERSPESKRILEEEGCVADVLWQPISADGPIERATSVRALTLVELSELPGLIQQGKHVLLTLGPCGLCHTPKGRLLASLLKQRRPLMTDLVVDTRTVAQMLRLKAQAGPEGH